MSYLTNKSCVNGAISAVTLIIIVAKVLFQDWLRHIFGVPKMSANKHLLHGSRNYPSRDRQDHLKFQEGKGSQK